MKSDPYCNQVIIVTGASSGIGKALALNLAEQGAQIAIAARRTDRLNQVAMQCRALGGETLVVPTDVSDEAQCKALVNRTVQEYGRLDMLINNAGLAVTAPFEEFPDLNLFKHTLDVNFLGAVYSTYYALPHLKQTSGRIVAISSIGGKAAIPYNTPYIASKYALHGFYDALRMELTQNKVSVTVVCPWWVVTEFHEAQMDKDGVPRGKRGQSLYSKRMMTANRCAEITLKAAARRRREVLMRPGLLAVWLKVIAPGALDWAAINLFLKPAIRRARASHRESG